MNFKDVKNSRTKYERYHKEESYIGFDFGGGNHFTVSFQTDRIQLKETPYLDQVTWWL